VARAAVKAKQQATAKAQATARARQRGRRKHSGGGNPNQELFFVRLRRHQKWIYAVLAVIFGLSFIFVGVGSGSGGGLSTLYNNLFGGSGGTSISKAQDEVKTNPAKGYYDLYTAYEQASQPALAITALQQYLGVKPQDADSWSLLGGLQQSQGAAYATQYQNAQASAQAADPSSSFLPGGALGSAVGSNPVYSDAAQTAAARTSLLYQKATGAYTGAVTSYQRASKLRPRNSTFLQELAQAAINAGNNPLAARSLRTYLNVYPHAPQRAAIEKEIASLSKGTSTAQSGNG
jgi:tetratricopeptide (TPR) repeat protein